MAIQSTRDALSRIFYQRCFWLFAVVLALIGAVSFVPSSDQGRLVLNILNMFVLIAAVAAVGRTTLSFTISLMLAIPAVWFQYSGLWNDDDRELAMSWMFSAGLYFVTTVYLLLAIPWEERSLTHSFGDDYRRYRRAVRWRIFPFIY